MSLSDDNFSIELRMKGLCIELHISMPCELRMFKGVRCRKVSVLSRQPEWDSFYGLFFVGKWALRCSNTLWQCRSYAVSVTSVVVSVGELNLRYVPVGL